MPESQAFWLMTTGLQVVDCFGKTPRARARIDEGGWLALTGEASADLNLACVLDGPAAAALLDNYLSEIDGLPTVLLLENPSPDLLELARRAGAAHLGEVPTMVWQGAVVESGTGDLDVRAATTDLEVEAAIALVAEAFSLDLVLAPGACSATRRHTRRPGRDRQRHARAASGRRSTLPLARRPASSSTQGRARTVGPCTAASPTETRRSHSS